jgi:hypothetical protein
MPTLLLTAAAALCAATNADDAPLADYFGFQGVEAIKIGDRAGPMYVADMNGDGLQDILIVNNHFSRIDLLLQDRNGDPADIPSVSRANEIPEHWRFDREQIMVPHKVTALATHDFDNDSRMDIVYAAQPSHVVFLRQMPDGTFEQARRHRVKDIAANRAAFSIHNIIDNRAPELITIADGNIVIYPITGDVLGKATEVPAGTKVVAFEIADYDGDGLDDIAGIAPDNKSPVRLWLARTYGGQLLLGPQIRFDMPTLREFAAVTPRDGDAALMAIIERASRRIVLYELVRESIETSGDREAAIEVHAFADSESGARSHVIVDVDEDGLLDVIATNGADNTVLVFRQLRNGGMDAPRSCPTLSGVDAIAACDIDGNGKSDLFVLSEDEGVVGRSPLFAGKVPFPQPVPIESGNTPVSLQTVELDEGWRLAVVSKQKRDYVLDLVDADGNRETIDLGSLSRGPDEILAFDADQDGRMDLLLLTRERPMKMLQATDDGFAVLDDSDMGQYGLVQEATADNTSIHDLDDDGHPELLIADDNFVRGVRYEPETEGSVSPGWQVVEQINIDDGSSTLASLASINEHQLIAADTDNDRLVLIGVGKDGSWSESDSLLVNGFELGPIHTGDFTGDGGDDILVMGDAGFAVVRLSGDRLALNEVQSWRSDETRRVQHELAVGDVNADGHVDMVSLDAGEQMLEIFTFGDSGRMMHATAFKVFESRIFSGGEPREFEPSQAIITDLTGDRASDILLLTHDRLLLYPQ